MKVYESVSELINNVNELINSKFDDVVKDVDDYKILFYDIDDIYLIYKVNMCLFVEKIVIYDDNVDLLFDEDYENVLMDLIFG